MNSMTKWSIVCIVLITIFTNLNSKNERILGWQITITILFLLYITEKEINNIEERRLINSMLIFSGTFSYLYFFTKEKKVIHPL